MSLPQRPYLTTRAHHVFALAYDLADRLGHEELTPAHVALGVLEEGRSLAVGALQLRGVPLDAVARELEAHLPPAGTPRVPERERAWGPRDEALLAQASAVAHELGTEHYGCEHLLLALLRDPTSEPARVLVRCGVGFDDVRAEVLRIYNARADAPPTPPPPPLSHDRGDGGSPA